MILVDTADRTALTICLAYPGLQGFTTNPTLLARSAGLDRLTATDYQAAVLRLLGQLPELAPRDGLRREIMLQGIGGTEEILAAAHDWHTHLDTAHWRLWVKLLPEWRALRAIRGLRDQGIATIVTAAFTSAQCRVAVDAGADGVAIYVGRLRHAEPHWHERVEAMTELVRRAGKRVLLASFPDLETVESATRLAEDLTIPAALVPRLLESPLTAAAINDFANRIG